MMIRSLLTLSAPMPIRRELRDLYPVLARSVGASASSAPEAYANAAAGRIVPPCAACRTGDGTIRHETRGATDAPASLVGPTWSRWCDCERRARRRASGSRSDQQRIAQPAQPLSALPPDPRSPAPIWRSGGSRICSAERWAIRSSDRTGIGDTSADGRSTAAARAGREAGRWPALPSYFSAFRRPEAGQRRRLPRRFYASEGSLCRCRFTVRLGMTSLPHGNTEGGEARFQPVLGIALREVLLPPQHAGD